MNGKFEEKKKTNNHFRAEKFSFKQMNARALLKV